MPIPPLDLGALLREAEASNPEIAAALSRRAAAEAIPSQVEALPDPVASASYTNVGLTESTLGAEGDTMLTLSWMQEVPLPGKRRLAGDAARREVEISGRRLELIRATLASQIKQAYSELYLADRTAEILKESRILLDSFLDSARARYETGQGLLQNVLKAQTEVSKLDVELEKLAQERLSIQAKLNSLAGRAAGLPLGPALVLPEPVGPLDVPALEKEAATRSPEIQETEAAVQRDEALLDLARRQIRPDFIWGAAYMYRGDLDPEIMGSLGLRLPLYKHRKQLQGIVQATHQLEAAKHDAAAMRLKVAAEVRDLAARAARSETLSKLYAEGIIPQARNALESAAAAYSVGQVDFLTLLNDFTTLLGYEVDYETQRKERVLALAGLERLTALVLVQSGGAAPPGGEASHE